MAKKSPPGEPPPHSRLFVVEVTAANDPAKVIGYAITEQVGFIDLAAGDRSRDLAEESGVFREGFAALFRALGAKAYRSLGIPAELDPGGGGYRMLTTASRGTTAGPGSGGQG